jgi:hypothetical protein
MSCTVGGNVDKSHVYIVIKQFFPFNDILFHFIQYNRFVSISYESFFFMCVVPCIFTVIILCIQQMHTVYYVKHFIGLLTCFDPEGSSSGHLIH